MNTRRIPFDPVPRARPGVLRRIRLDPATFEAVDRGDQLALFLEDEFIVAGDDLFAEKCLAGTYQGRGKLLHVTHVERRRELAEGWCVVSVRAVGDRLRS